MPPPPAGGHRKGHNQATTASGATCTEEAGICGRVIQGRGESLGEERGLSSQTLNTGERENAISGGWGAGYCVALRVPFVLIKKARRLGLQWSLAEKC